MRLMLILNFVSRYLQLKWQTQFFSFFFLGGFTAPLNYYRNLFTLSTIMFNSKTYNMPALIIWGTDDEAL